MKISVSFIIRIIILLIFLGAVGVLHYYVNDIRHDVATEQAKLEAIDRQSEEQSLSNRQLDEYRARVNTIMASIPVRQSFPQVLAFLEDAGVRYNLTVQTNNFKESVVDDKTESPIQEIAIPLTAQGDPEKLLQYLQYIELTSPYIVKLDEWRLIVEEQVPVNRVGVAEIDQSRAQPTEPPARLEYTILVSIKR